MQLVLAKKNLQNNPANFLRQAGYTYIESRHTGHGSFVKHFSGQRYPRFHIYIKELVEQIVFDAHLDQKQASYEGSHAHSGEYDGPLVEQELNRLRTLAGSGEITNQRFKESEQKGQPSRAQRWSDIINNN